MAEFEPKFLSSQSNHAGGFMSQTTQLPAEPLTVRCDWQQLSRVSLNSK